jgi:hypothetical protein
MTRNLTAATAATLAALCLAPTVSLAASKDLWATVNLCDTKKHPRMMGVRARMPGTRHGGARQRMFMRFTAEYRSAGKWLSVDGGRSAWIHAGPAKTGFQDRGYNFPLNVAKGESYVFRGRVEFEWRKRRSGRLVKARERITEPGHPTSTSDPKGFSRARCRIATPK